MHKDFKERKEKVVEAVNAHFEGLSSKQLYELVKAYMSKPTLREILQELEGLGIIEVKRGRRGQKNRIMPASKKHTYKRLMRKESLMIPVFATLLNKSYADIRNRTYWERCTMTKLEIAKYLGIPKPSSAKLTYALKNLSSKGVIKRHHGKEGRYSIIELLPFDSLEPPKSAKESTYKKIRKKVKSIFSSTT